MPLGLEGGVNDGQQQDNLGIPGLTGAVEVGRGGFAVVYRCHQETFGRTVAVKVLRDAINDETARRRFQRECLAMGMLSGHPNIVTVYEAGFRPAGDPYIVMDFMTGGSLADRVAAKGPMSWQDVLSAAVMLLGALHSAHEAGVLHRDIKPENVMRSSYGAVKLTDFGIARLRHGPQTRTEGLTASIPHVAPELIAGGPASVQSDLYAVGSTMFHLLSGRAAFLRDTDESILPALQRIASEPVPDLRTEGIPDEICDVIEHLMDKDPARRPSSALVVGEELRRLQRRFELPPTPLAVAETPHLPEDSDDLAEGAASASVFSPEARPSATDDAPSPATPDPPRPAPPPTPLPRAPRETPSPADADPSTPPPKPPPHPDFRPQPPPPPPRRGSARTATGRGGLRWVGWAAGIAVVAALAAASLLLGRSATPVAPPTAAAGTGPTEQASSAQSEDPPPGELAAVTRLEPDAIEGTGQVASGGAADYDLTFLLDQRPATAWSVQGDGVGESVKLQFDEPVRITRIGMIPGDARVDPDGDRVDRYASARRIEQVRLRFGEEAVTKATFTSNNDWDMEFVDVDVVSDEIEIVVLASSSGDENRTAISEIALFGGEAADLPVGPVAELPSTLEAQRHEPAEPPPAGSQGRYVFPVYPVSLASYLPGHNAYPASDIYAPCGTAVVAPTSGRMTELEPVDRWSPTHNLGPVRGGIFVTMIGDDGVRYYLSHLGEIADGLQQDAAVEAGEPLGTVGRSGTAADQPCHIHLGFSQPGSGPQDWRPRRGTVDPHPYLEAWRAGRERSPARAVRRAG